MISGNGPDHACGVAHFTERLLRQLSLDRPDASFVWLSRRAMLKQVPFAVQSQNILQIRPSHTWRPTAWHLAGALMAAWRPQIVHIQDEVHSFHETRAAVELAWRARRAGARVAVTLHEYHTHLASVKHTDELVSLADAIFVQDARNGERCLERSGKVPAAVGWSPANIDPPAQAVTPIPNRFVTFGLLNRAKGLELVGEALRTLKGRHRDLTWHIMGPFDPVNNEYHRELEQRFTEPWIVFTGGGAKEMGQARFRIALASATGMLLPFADGCSPRRTTLQAAWAFGLPTITTAPEVSEPSIRDGDNCSLMPGMGASMLEQVRAWAEAAERLVVDAAYGERLREGSRTAARAHSWQKLGDQHEVVYSKWLGARS